MDGMLAVVVVQDVARPSYAIKASWRGKLVVKEDKREEKLGWRDGAGLRTRFSLERHESNQGVLTSWTADDGGTTLRFFE